MKIITRYLLPTVQEDLREKMAFVSGPRQVGKTTLARQILERQPGLYLNWDNSRDRKTILQGTTEPGVPRLQVNEHRIGVGQVA